MEAVPAQLTHLVACGFVRPCSATRNRAGHMAFDTGHFVRTPSTKCALGTKNVAHSHSILAQFSFSIHQRPHHLMGLGRPNPLGVDGYSTCAWVKCEAAMDHGGVEGFVYNSELEVGPRTSEAPERGIGAPAKSVDRAPRWPIRGTSSAKAGKGHRPCCTPPALGGRLHIHSSRPVLPMSWSACTIHTYLRFYKVHIVGHRFDREY
jgi:hypothetical protein